MKTLAMACLLTASLTATGGSAAPDTQTKEKTVLPVPTREVKPAYPKAAMKDGVQGSVVLTVRVEAAGTVGDVKVAKSLSPTLDAEAVKAARQWRFTPGTRGGKPVPVEVQLEMTFKLR